MEAAKVNKAPVSGSLGGAATLVEAMTHKDKPRTSNQSTKSMKWAQIVVRVLRGRQGTAAPTANRKLRGINEFL